MSFRSFFQSGIFFVFYRVIFPVIFVILFFIIPWLKFSISDYQPFDWGILLFITVMLSAAYYSVTFLGEIPTKSAAWLRLWRRFGTFKDNNFLPYFDRSSLRYFYYLNAVGASATTSVVLGYMLIIHDIFSGKVSFVIAAINFLMLFIPYTCQFNDFEKAIYRSDLATSRVSNLPK